MRMFNGKARGETVGGFFQGNITNLNGLCYQVLVTPETDSTQYSFQIINPDDVVVFERTSEVGELAELTMLPLYGTYTIKILEASTDEHFEICLVAQEG